MATVLLPLQPGSLSVGVCFPDEQSRLNAYMSVSSAILAGGLAFYNFGPDKPSVDNQAFPWFRTTDGRWYFFSGVWKAPMNYTTFDRRLFFGTLTDLITYDGGDNGTPSDTSGPTWVEDTVFQGRSPMGPGAIPASNPALTLNLGDLAGEGAHLQTTSELAQHSHPPASNYQAFAGFVSVGQPSSFEITGGTEIEKMGTTGDTGGAATAGAGANTAFNVVHPCVGIYVIKWSQGRRFYTVP